MPAVSGAKHLPGLALPRPGEAGGWDFFYAWWSTHTTSSPQPFERLPYPWPHPLPPVSQMERGKAQGQGHKLVLNPGMSYLAHRVPPTEEIWAPAGWLARGQLLSMSGLSEAGGRMQGEAASPLPPQKEQGEPQPPGPGLVQGFPSSLLLSSSDTAATVCACC